MNDLQTRIETAISKIRPYLEADGGDIEIVSVENNVVKVRLLGACSNCSMSMMTMKAGIEETIKRDVPEIEKVLAINDLEVVS